MAEQKEPKDGESREVKHEATVLQFRGEKPKVEKGGNHAMTPPPADFNVKP